MSYYSGVLTITLNNFHKKLISGTKTTSFFTLGILKNISKLKSLEQRENIACEGQLILTILIQAVKQPYTAVPRVTF